jgi:phospholipase C
MDTRRDFLKKAVMLAGGAGLMDALLPAIERAATILPAEGSSYADAEHVVILMQENRSFDHCFGTLRGVRGFSDPRAVTLPNQHPVWLQTNAKGETYAPFRLDAQRTNATWLGSLPHSWTDQNDAKNGGDHDKWLIAKPVKKSDPAGMPLTLGYYAREDLPFYYALADAFTICDQHFCSSLTGTTPNRLYLWTGTVREEQKASSPAKVRNENVDYDAPARWTTFPERLEDAGVSWKIYQNELSAVSGLTEDEDAWLANFTDNPIEWFPQYAVEYAEGHRQHAARMAEKLPGEIEELEMQGAAEKTLNAKRKLLKTIVKERAGMKGTFVELPERTWNLHSKAFTTNASDPSYRELTELRYEDGGVTRELQIPKGDVLHQFRQDVASGQLPAVSWIVAPEKFSDHPSAAWYGAWYVAEVMNILTQNPEVWRKTIFILTYDENDGFFDHVPPFGAPQPRHPETGAVSDGIDVGLEYHSLEQDLKDYPASKARGGSIGLGFRVPLVVASPWSRGGAVCSQVFDHTSVLQLLENFATRKSGKVVKETNITEWRRTVCGDLTSVFTAAADTATSLPFPNKNEFLEQIHVAQFRGLPSYEALTAEQIAGPREAWLPKQEPGVRPARALPYRLGAEGRLSTDRQSIEVTLATGNAVGAPFRVYPRGLANKTRSYAVKAGQVLRDKWDLAGFADGKYDLNVCGPNGFLLRLTGDVNDPLIETSMGAKLSITNRGKSGYKVLITHNAYGLARQTVAIKAGATREVAMNLKASHGWYDFTVRVEGFANFKRDYAGHVENGEPSFSDPQIGA